MIRRQLIRTASLAVLAAALPLAAWAQADYPSKPVKIIVPFPAGGTSDVMGRLIAEELGKALKQPFVVENIGGAGGAIGAERGAKAAADGYTLTLTGVGSNAVNHGLNPKLGYDSNKDYAHITQIHSGPNVLVVHPDTPFKTFKELVAYVKANPGKMNYGYTPAASGHMAMEQLKQTAGLFMVGIPYRGGGPLMTDLLGNTVPMIFINQDAALQHVKAGKLRPLAVTSAQRNPLYPDVPTVAESGYPNFEAISWSGLSAPKGTPKPILDKLEAAATAAMQSAPVKAKLESQGFVVPAQGSAVYTKFVASEIDRWTKVIKTAGIKPE
ncbi:MAG TPA: tripartite tricarboxylate transporter substrate binding protein [Ramlibacter sp.]|nr:tripartite tricarboxylate transporter substrate binding protein [Ramlibacter sp.]